MSFFHCAWVRLIANAGSKGCYAVHQLFPSLPLWGEGDRQFRRSRTLSGGGGDQNLHYSIFTPHYSSTELALSTLFLHYAWGVQEVLKLCARHQRDITGDISLDSQPLKEGQELIRLINQSSFRCFPPLRIPPFVSAFAKT